MLALRKNSLTKEQLRFAEFIGIKISEDGYNLKTIKSEHLKIMIDGDILTIYYGRICELYRALALTCEISFNDLPIEQPRKFDSLAAFYDCSRNAVLSEEMLEKCIMELAALGYDQLYIYTEDTFEIPEYPYFGHLRGRYTADEIKTADAFAKVYGIELIPAIQTLAHLANLCRWDCFSDVVSYGTLKCGDEKTYQLIDRMFASIRNMYSTDKINIGMDEAHSLGADGMNKFLKHLERVSAIAEKYGFKPIVWSDMFFKLAVGEMTFNELKAAEFSPEILKLIPENVILAYWWYNPSSKDYYDTMIGAHKAMKRHVIFNGGFRKWVGFCPSMQWSLDASRTALESCEEHGIKDVVITGWGDSGAEAAFYTMLPGLVLYSEKCYTGITDDTTLDCKLKALYGHSLSDFFLLEKPNKLFGNKEDQKKYDSNPSKTILWNDPITGLYDLHIPDGANEYYKSIADELNSVRNIPGRISYIFETVYYLCDILSEKAEIGNLLRKAYKSDNKQEMELLLISLKLQINKLDAFQRKFRENWLRENKIFGFQIQDIRFGALRSRLVYATELIEGFLNGNCKKIAEFEETPLYMDCRQNDDKPLHYCVQNWNRLVTVHPMN